jgi:hypothetical protein
MAEIDGDEISDIAPTDQADGKSRVLEAHINARAFEQPPHDAEFRTTRGHARVREPHDHSMIRQLSHKWRELARHHGCEIQAKRTTEVTKKATRVEAFALSKAIADDGHPHLAAVPLICFEWLQRPKNVLAGHLGWGDIRASAHPHYVRIDHHKTGKEVLQFGGCAT